MATKYKTYTELAEAFRTGELNKDNWVLILDNDACHLRWVGPDDPGVDADEFEERKYKEAEGLFQGNGEADFEEVVSALGIPCEPC